MSRSLGAAALLVALVVTALALPRPAAAAVREAAITFDRPETPPSLDDRPPVEERERYLETALASYDNAAGTLTIRARLFAAEIWGRGIAVSFGVDSACADVEAPTVRGSFSASSKMVYIDPEHEGFVPVDAAELRVAGYEGKAPGTLEFDGRTFTATYAHAALRGLDLRCLDVRGASSPSSAETNGEGRAWFRGFAPITLTATRGRAALRADVERRHGRLLQAYVKCAHVWRGDDGSQNVGCMAEFRAGPRWHLYSTTASVAPYDNVVTVARKPWHRSWVRRWRRAGAACLRHGAYQPMRGVLESNGFGCDARLAADIYRGVTGWHGTDTGSFLPITRYHCRKRASTYTCRNGMGDAFRWTPAP